MAVEVYRHLAAPFRSREGARAHARPDAHEKRRIIEQFALRGIENESNLWIVNGFHTVQDVLDRILVDCVNRASIEESNRFRTIHRPEGPIWQVQIFRRRIANHKALHTVTNFQFPRHMLVRHNEMRSAQDDKLFDLPCDGFGPVKLPPLADEIVEDLKHEPGSGNSCGYERRRYLDDIARGRNDRSHAFSADNLGDA